MHLLLVPSPAPSLGLQLQTFSCSYSREVGLARIQHRIITSQPIQKPQYVWVGVATVQYVRV